jgi:hypothetical protein
LTETNESSVRRGSGALAGLDALLVAAGLVLLGLTPRNATGDGDIRYQQLQALTHGTFLHQKYSLVEPLLAVPFAWIGRLVGHEQAVVYRFNVVVLGLGLLALCLLLRKSDALLVRPLCLLLVFGSMFAAHVNGFYGETVTAVGLAVGLLSIAVAERRLVRAAGWVLLIVAAVNSPAVVPAVALAVVLHTARTRHYRYLLVLPVMVGLALVDARLHTGSFHSPYADDHGFQTVLPYSGRPGFSYPALLGIGVLLVSFGKGLLFFAPGGFLSLKGRLAQLPRTRAVYPLWTAVTVGLVAVYCRWWAWYGGFFWGPRFFLFASIPAALVLAVRLITPSRSIGGFTVTLGALLLTTWVAICACIGPVGQQACRADHFAREDLCWYSPEYSVLWRPVAHWPDLTAAQHLYIGLAVVALLRLAVPLCLAARQTLTVRVPLWLQPVPEGVDVLA